MPPSYAVGEHFEQFIRQQVEGGRYASALSPRGVSVRPATISTLYSSSANRRFEGARVLPEQRNPEYCAMYFPGFHCSVSGLGY
jgi:Bacterial antitoxin of ParD toxin-antitoxin type II system and RHH